MAKQQQRSNQDTGETDNAAPDKDVSRSSSPQVLAGKCPRNPSHRMTRVYKTVGRKRYCKCNDCGELWTMTGDYADPLRQFCHTLADSLEKTERDEVGGEQVVVIPDAEAKNLTGKLRELAAG